MGVYRRLRARLEPALANIVVWRLRQHRVQRHRHRHHQFRAGLGSVCARPFAGLVGNLSAVTALAGNSCNPDYSFYQVGSRTQWNPVAHLDIGLDITYTGLNTAYKGAGVYAANGSRPPVTVFDDQGVWSAMVRWQRNFYP